jgi:FMN hydrolase / 5-amino-6-(5-phospho-D-ribitylamino)uracil phosphatase
VSETIKVVSFDGDGTLWDIRAAARSALSSTASTISSLLPRGSPEVTVARLEQERDEIESEHPSWKMEQLRRESFRRVATKFGLDASTCDDLWDDFIAARIDCTKPFEDVVPAFRALRSAGKKVALLSNGNTQPERVGLAGQFDFVQIGELIDLRKPSIEFYLRAASEMGINIASILHVGDSRTEDFEAAMSAGAHAILLDRWGSSSMDAISTLLEVYARIVEVETGSHKTGTLE